MFMDVVSVIGTLVGIAAVIGGATTYILKQNPSRKHIIQVSISIGIVLLCIILLTGGIAYLSTKSIFAQNQKPTPTVKVPTAPASPTKIAYASPTQAAQPSSAGNVTEFSLPNNDRAIGLTAGPDGNLWFTENQEDNQENITGHAIGRISPSGTITEFPLANSQEGVGITAGPDGNLWSTEYKYTPGSNGNAGTITDSTIGRISPIGTITEFPLPSNGGPHDITVGPDGNLWFTEYHFDNQFHTIGGKIGRISPIGQIAEFPLPNSSNGPIGITAGPDGDLWFTEYHFDNKDNVTGSAIGRISPSGTITEFPLPISNSGPYGITVGADGNLWFTGSQFDNQSNLIGSEIGRITSNGTYAEFPLPKPSSGATPSEITAGPDGNLWFTEYGYTSTEAITGSVIGRISLSGEITIFSLSASSSGPNRITVGPDNNLWFTEDGDHKIGRITSGK